MPYCKNPPLAGFLLPDALVVINQFHDKRLSMVALLRNDRKRLCSSINYIGDNLGLMHKDNCRDTYLIVAVPGEKTCAWLY
jgi:hypothetical protein